MRLLALAAAEADRREALQQRQAALLRMLVGELAALRAHFVLRRDRQFVDSRHPRRTGRRALRLRREHGLGTGQLEWLTNPDPDVLTFRSGGVTVIANTGAGTVPLPEGRVILDSGDAGDGLLPGDTTVWMVGE